MRVIVDKSLSLSASQQVCSQITILIRTGELHPGARLPTIKELARELNLNYNTVAGAYRDLERQGYVTQKRRAGTHVAATLPRDSKTAILTHFTAIVAQQLRAFDVDPEEAATMLAANLSLDKRRQPLNVAVLARTPLQAVQVAARAQVLLGATYICVPQTPYEYRSGDYHLSVVDPELIASLAYGTEPNQLATKPYVELHSATFPAGAD